MVAELEVELGQMRGRLEQAERTLLEQVTTLNKAEEAQQYGGLDRLLLELQSSPLWGV